MRITKKSRLLGAAALAVITFGAHAAPTYTITDRATLGRVNGASISVDDSGQVAGYFVTTVGSLTRFSLANNSHAAGLERRFGRDSNG